MKTYKILEEQTYYGTKFYVQRKSIFGFWYDIYLFGPGWGNNFPSHDSAKQYIDRECYTNKIIKETTFKCDGNTTK